MEKVAGRNPISPTLSRWVAKQPEVIVSDAQQKHRIGRAVRAGLLRRLAHGVYTKNLVTPPEVLVRRHLWDLIGQLLPGAVISYRTAFEAQPTPTGVVWVTWRRRRGALELPGHTIVSVAGPGAQDGDVPYLGVTLASEPRQFLENLQRGYTTRVGSRVVSRADLERRLEQILQNRGEAGLNKVRDQARALAPALGREAEMATLDRLIGTLLGSHDAPLITAAGQARTRGLPFDPGVMERLDQLFTHLQTQPYPLRVDVIHAGAAWDHLAFFDAYFSNYIEGTTFEIAEAEEIVFQNRIIPQRRDDSHDILGTYRVVYDLDDMRTDLRSYPDATTFLGRLRERHRTILASRPSKEPGAFKTRANRAGTTEFVPPDLVVGTLVAGYERGRALQAAFARAVYVMALVTEVHPFADGNGRVARACMNAELIAADERRILIPTVFRDDYLGALRRFTRQRDVTLLPQVLTRAQALSAQIDFTDRRRALAQLTATQAFREPADAKLILPSEFP